MLAQRWQFSARPRLELCVAAILGFRFEQSDVFFVLGDGVFDVGTIKRRAGLLPPWLRRRLFIGAHRYLFLFHHAHQLVVGGGVILDELVGKRLYAGVGRLTRRELRPFDFVLAAHRGFLRELGVGAHRL